jgi:hypothetical protein
MNRLFACLVLALLSLLALPAVSGASHSTKKSGGHRDFTIGAGLQSLPLGGSESFRFDAYADGRGVRGYEVANGDLDGAGPLPPFMFSGPVTCLAVVGNRASFFYEFESAEPSFFQGGGVQVYVEDNGAPLDGQPVDGTAFDAPIPGPGPGLPPLEGPTVCPPPRLTGYDVLESGDAVVHDATP